MIGKSIDSLVEFHKFVKTDILPLVRPKTLILLEGEVGTGKTELVKTLCGLLKLQDVQSPTFAFHNLYANSQIKLHHVDLYRVKNEEDLESTGFWDLFENESDTILIEWSNLISAEAWPWGWRIIRIEINKNQGEKRYVRILQEKPSF